MYVYLIMMMVLIVGGALIARYVRSIESETEPVVKPMDYQQQVKANIIQLMVSTNSQ